MSRKLGSIYVFKLQKRYIIQSGGVCFLPFHDKTSNKASAIPFELNDYIALVDWSGRAILANKRGSIRINTPPILSRLRIDEKDWLNHIHYFERQFPTASGSIEKLKQLAEKTSCRWIKGMGKAFKPLPA